MSKARRRIFSILVLLAGLLAAVPASAGPAVSPWDGGPEGEVRLLAARSAAGGAATLRFGLEFRLAPGWKTYWRNPGESGAPPQFDWSGSGNLADVSVEWPVPVRFTAFGTDSFGYHDAVVLPLTVRPRRPGAPLALRLHLRFLVCETVCIPGEARLALDLPAGPAAATAEAAHIAKFAARLPKRGAAAPFSVGKAVLSGAPGQQVLTLHVRAPDGFEAPDAMVEGPQGFAFGRPEVTLADAGRSAVLRLPVLGIGKAALDPGVPLTVTLVDGARAAEASLTARAGS